MRQGNYLQRNFRRKSALALMAAIWVAFSFAHSAYADAIDGDWCHSNGKRMSIRGPAIVTHGGQETRGRYTRHYFSYVIPAGETGAGADVSGPLLLRCKALTCYTPHGPWVWGQRGETARTHYAPRWRCGDVAARGTRAAGETRAPGLSRLRLSQV